MDTGPLAAWRAKLALALDKARVVSHFNQGTGSVKLNWVVSELRALAGQIKR